MTTTAHAALSDCVRAIGIVDECSYSFLGLHRKLKPNQPVAYPALTNRMGSEPPIVASIAGDIYSQIYAKLKYSRYQGMRSERVPFVARISAANQSRHGWEAGWSLRCRTGQTCIVVRDALQIEALISQLYPNPEYAGTGRLYQLDVGKELFNIVSGWYFALGECPDKTDIPSIFTRVYVNIACEEAIRLVELCTRTLNGAEIPFRLKLPDDPAAYGRADAAVLYLPKHYYRTHEPLLLSMLSRIRTRDGVPAFTKQVGRGLAVAEDPGDGSSFGQSRSYLIARGLWRAFQQRVRSIDATTGFVIDEFQRAGLDCSRPYLGPQSEDVYGISVYGN